MEQPRDPHRSGTHSVRFLKALVEEASGKGYVVEIGTSIGRERGKVVEIEKDRLIIQQEGEDDFGDTVVRKKEMKLQKPPGE